MHEVARIVGYIMYCDLLSEIINGSYYTKIDKAVELATEFEKLYPEDYEWEDSDLDWDETLELFVKEKIQHGETR